MALQFCSKLGLRFPNKSQSPFVQDMYVRDMGEIIDSYARSDLKVFATSSALRSETDALCDKYGDAIWPSDTARPWLFNVGEGDEKAPYSKKLYWADLTDREFIKTTMFQLAVARTKKRRSRLRCSLPPSYPLSADDAWSPSLRSTRAATHRSSNAFDGAHECFGHLSNGLLSHTSLDKLKGEVWLGSAWDDDVVVSGEPFKTVSQRLLSDTISRATKDPSFSDKPYVFDHVPATTSVRVACAGCGVTVFREGSDAPMPMLVTCETMHIDDKDDDGRPYANLASAHEENGAQLDTNSWFFNIPYGSNKVFAFVKPERRGKEQYWHFWMKEGGYSSTYCLKTIHKESNGVESNGVAKTPPEAPRSAPARTDSRPSHFTALNGRKRARTSASAEYVPSDRSSSEEVQRLLSAHGSDDEEERTPRRQRRAESDVDSLYRVTPGLQEGRRFHAINHTPRPSAGVEHRIASAQNEATQSALGSAFDSQRPSAGLHLPMRPADGSATSAMEAPAYKHRFLVWLYVGGASGRNAVYLDDSMSVQRVFELFREKLQRQLKGKGRSLEAVAIGIPGLDEEKINLEVDDKDGWEAVQEIVLEAGVKTVYGNVISGEGGD